MANKSKILLIFTPYQIKFMNIIAIKFINTMDCKYIEKKIKKS